MGVPLQNCAGARRMLSHDTDTARSTRSSSGPVVVRRTPHRGSRRLPGHTLRRARLRSTIGQITRAISRYAVDVASRTLSHITSRSTLRRTRRIRTHRRHPRPSKGHVRLEGSWIALAVAASLLLSSSAYARFSEEVGLERWRAESLGRLTSVGLMDSSPDAVPVRRGVSLDAIIAALEAQKDDRAPRAVQFPLAEETGDLSTILDSTRYLVDSAVPLGEAVSIRIGYELRRLEGLESSFEGMLGAGLEYRLGARGNVTADLRWSTQPSGARGEAGVGFGFRLGEYTSLIATYSMISFESAKDALISGMGEAELEVRF